MSPSRAARAVDSSTSVKRSVSVPSARAAPGWPIAEGYRFVRFCDREMSTLGEVAPTETVRRRDRDGPVASPNVCAAPLIEGRGLTKRFGSFEAVAGIDFTVQPGEAFGFLGPNGAGK